MLLFVLAFILLGAAVIVEGATAPSPKNWGVVGLALLGMVFAVLAAAFGNRFG